MAGGRGLPLPGAPVVWGLADAVHEPVLYLSENKTGNRHVQAGRVGRIPQQRPSGKKGLTLNILQLATTVGNKKRRAFKAPIYQITKPFIKCYVV